MVLHYQEIRLNLACNINKFMRQAALIFLLQIIGFTFTLAQDSIRITFEGQPEAKVFANSHWIGNTDTDGKLEASVFYDQKETDIHMEKYGFQSYNERVKLGSVKLIKAKLRPQKKGKAPKDNNIYQAADRNPLPEIGLQAYYQYIAQKLRYPDEARINRIEGTVYLTFIVNHKGETEGVKVLKGIGYGCDEAALEVIRDGVKWFPAVYKGRSVKVRMQLPMIFSLN